jgi:hypothetical protein
VRELNQDREASLFKRFRCEEKAFEALQCNAEA